MMSGVSHSACALELSPSASHIACCAPGFSLSPSSLAVSARDSSEASSSSRPAHKERSSDGRFASTMISTHQRS